MRHLPYMQPTLFSSQAPPGVTPEDSQVWPDNKTKENGVCALVWVVTGFVNVCMCVNLKKNLMSHIAI